jgi:hypothetical protein
MCGGRMRAVVRAISARWIRGSSANGGWLLAALSVALLPTSDSWRTAPWGEIDPPRSAPAQRTACEGDRPGLPETLFFHLENAAFRDSGHPDVAVHVPPGFDATRRPGLLVYFHGWQGCVQAAMGDGDVPCREGGDPRAGSAIAAQVDQAGVNALAVAIELRPDMPSGEPGNLAVPGAFHELLRELLTEKLAPYVGCGIEVDGLDRVVVVAHSGGYQAAANVLSVGDVPQIREVVLLDALYGAQDVFLRWMRDGLEEDTESLAGPSRRFVDIFTCCAGTAEASRIMAKEASRASSDATLLAPTADDAIADALPTILDESDRELDTAGLARRWLFKRVPDPHEALPRMYFAIIAQSVGFERR